MALTKYKRYPHMHWLVTAALALFIAIIPIFGRSLPAQAAFLTGTIVSINTNPTPAAAVVTGGTFSVQYTATFDGGTTWNSTEYRFGTSGNFTCVNTGVQSSGATVTFTATAPGTIGTRTLQVQARTGACATNNASNASMAQAVNGVIVVATAPSANPNLIPQCGIDIVLVLDESGSIYGVGGAADIRSQVRSGASALIAALQDTGSRIAVVEFNTIARRAVINGSTAFQTINAAYVTAFNSYINASLAGSNPWANRYEPQDYSGDINTQYTNWQSAFFQVNAIGGTPRPLVLFFTDGNPTATGDTSGTIVGTSQANIDTSVSAAVPNANTVKNAGSHVYMLGVPNLTVAEPNLIAVSGPDKFPVPQPSIALADYSVANASEVGNALLALVTQLCGVSVQVTKTVDDDNNPSTPATVASGWTFTGTVRVPNTGGTSYTWQAPQTPPGTPAAGVAASGNTNASGVVNFGWKYNPLTLAASSRIDIRENATATQLDQYRLSSITCPTLPGGATLATNTNNGVATLNTLPKSSTAACVYLNIRKPKITTLCEASSFHQGNPNNNNPFVEGTVQNTDNMARATGWTMTISIPEPQRTLFAFNGSYSATLNGSTTPTTCSFTGNHTAVCTMNPTPANNVLNAGDIWKVKVFGSLLVPSGPTINPTVTANSNGAQYQTVGSITSDTCAVTTPVTVSYFKSVPEGDGVRFDWSTATETNNAGFNLYVEQNGVRTKLNDQLIPTAVLNSFSPQDYTFTAAGVGGDLFYIEDVDIFTMPSLHGPYRLGEAYGERGVVDPINWDAITAEHNLKVQERRGVEAGAVNAELAALPKLPDGTLLDQNLFLPLTSAAAADPEAHAAALSPRGTGVQVTNLLVAQTGVYRITFEQLAATYPALAGTPTSGLALINNNEAVAIKVNSADSVFNAGDSIDFLGEAKDTLYTNQNVYTLRVDNRFVKRITDATLPMPKNATPASFYLDTATVERDLSYQFTTPNGDPWIDTWMLARPNGTWNFPVSVDNYVQGAAPVTLAVNMWGAGSWPGISPNHRVLVSLNGAGLGNEVFDGLQERNVQYELPAGTALNQGPDANTVTLNLPNDLGGGWDIVNLDSYGLTYPRAFVARNGSLSFTATGAAFRVTGLTSDQVVVYRDNRGDVKRLTNVQVTPDGGGYAATFPGVNALSTYWVISANSLLKPNMATIPSNTDITSGNAEYLVIAHPDFVNDPSLDRLVAYHTANGVTVRKVDVRQVYQQFSGNVFDAKAIQDYITYAAANMGAKYVLLVGGDTIDYRGYLPAGQRGFSFIPSLYTGTGLDMGFSPADPLYGDVDGDSVPDVAVGRFPVRSSSELASVVDKTLAYSQASYAKSAIFASGTGFSTDNAAIAALMPAEWTITPTNLDESSAGVVKAAFTGAVNNGVALASYVGHSGPTSWNFPTLFSAADASALSNAGKPTVVTQWGCWNNYYVDPANNTLAHKFLFNGDPNAYDSRGAAAVLGATGISYGTHERLLGQALMQKLTASSGVRLGDALLAAKRDIAVHGSTVNDVVLGWTLLGDPLIVINR